MQLLARSMLKMLKNATIAFHFQSATDWLADRNGTRKTTLKTRLHGGNDGRNCYK